MTGMSVRLGMRTMARAPCVSRSIRIDGHDSQVEETTR